MSTLPDVQRALAQVGFEIIESTPEAELGSQLRIVGRVPASSASAWIAVAQHILVVSRASPWNVDVSRSYFLRDFDGIPKMFYAWRLIFQAPKETPKIAGLLASIVQSLQTAPRPVQKEIEEVQLHGAGAYRTQLQNGKGAQPFGTARIGPLALVNRG